MRSSLFNSQALIFASFVLCGALQAAGSDMTAFDETGVLVSLPSFFSAAPAQADMQAPPDGVSGLALVTASGVYSFLETPENAKALNALVAGGAAHVVGKQFTPGRLLEIESAELVLGDAGLNIAQFASAEGKVVNLNGTNKCQCGLKVGSLHTSCDLGHLHHLEATDGKTYHYLQLEPALDTFLGKGYHFKNVKVKARELPGQFLLVETAEVVE